MQAVIICTARELRSGITSKKNCTISNGYIIQVSIWSGWNGACMPWTRTVLFGRSVGIVLCAQWKIVYNNCDNFSFWYWSATKSLKCRTSQWDEREQTNKNCQQQQSPLTAIFFQSGFWLPKIKSCKCNGHPLEFCRFALNSSWNI